MEYKIVGDDFRSYSEAKLKDIYKSAIFNGFDYGWKPKDIIRIKEIEI